MTLSNRREAVKEMMCIDMATHMMCRNCCIRIFKITGFRKLT